MATSLTTNDRSTFKINSDGGVFLTKVMSSKLTSKYNRFVFDQMVVKLKENNADLKTPEPEQIEKNHK